jgi:hypothetical protein
MGVGGISLRTLADFNGSGNWKVPRRVSMHLGRSPKSPLLRFPLREKPDYHVLKWTPNCSSSGLEVFTRCET